MQASTFDNYVFSEIIDRVSHYIFWKDCNLVFRGCNKAFASQFGFKNQNEIIGKTDADFPWTLELKNKYLQDDQEVINTGKAKLNYEEYQRQSDGSLKTILVSKVPFYNNENIIVGVLGIYTDITEKFKSEAAVKKLLKIEQEHSQLLEILSGSIAHELRTPLASLRVGIAGLSAELPKLIDFYEKHQTEKKISSRKLKGLRMLPGTLLSSVNSAFFIIDMLLMNVKESSIKEKVFQIQSISTIIDATINEYPFTASEKALVHWEKNNDFDYAGQTQLTKYVLFNLIKNALHFIAAAGKGTISIRLETDTDTDTDKKFNQLIFKDTGLGISAEYLPSIFEKFKTNCEGGTGLGLAFCKLVMEAYGGKIECNSIENEFTEFVLFFPKI